MPRFSINYTFQGRAHTIIEAETLEDAEAKIEAEIERDDFELDADEIDDVDFDIREMHPVTRDGREIWATYRLDSDIRDHRSTLATSPLFSGEGEQK